MTLWKGRLRIDVGVRLRVTRRVLDECGEYCTEFVLFVVVKCVLPYLRAVRCTIAVCTVQRSGLYACTRQVHIQYMFDDEGRNV